MKSLNHLQKLIPMKSLLLLLLLLTPLTSNAVLSFTIYGQIVEVSNTHIGIDDGFYPFLSTVKLFDTNGKVEPISNLKIGDPVVIKILKLDNQKRVESIQRVAE